MTIDMFRGHRQVKIEDTKEVVRSRKSKKDRQHNGQRKNIERTNNNVENIAQKTKDLTKPQKTGSELMCSFHYVKDHLYNISLYLYTLLLPFYIIFYYTFFFTLQMIISTPTILM
jgi:Ca2+-dependent lipid-binding protein